MYKIKEILDFLQELELNNNREWFDENRDWYKEIRKNVIALTNDLIKDISAFYDLGDIQTKHCIFRINRDTRFSKNKTPYKLNFGIEIANGGRRSGKPSFYLHIQPGNHSFIGGGIYMPTPEFTKEIRNGIDKDFKSLNKILQNKKFKKEFGYFVENVDRVKTAPKGFSKDHKNIELIRLKHWVTNKALNDKDILEKGFYDKLLESFKTMAALNRWLEDKFDNIK